MDIHLEIDLLKKMPLLEGLKIGELKQVLEAAKKHKLDQDAYLFFEGDPATIIYVLTQGKVKLSQVTTEGQQVILHYISPGDAFGLIAVQKGALYPVTAQAVEDSQLLAWDQAVMNRLMEQNTQIALNSVQILTSMVREFQDRVRELSTEKVERRIARALLRLAQQTGKKVSDGILIDLPLSRQDLAEMTGTTLFTVSRTLSRWEARGILRTGRELVIIRFPHGLVKIAEDLPDVDRNDIS